MTDSTLSLDHAVDLTRTGDLWLFRGRSLADRGVEQGRFQRQADPVRPAEPLQSGRRENQGVELSGIELSETGVQIAAGLGKLQVRPMKQKLSPAAEASGSHPCFLWQRVQAANLHRLRKEQDVEPRGPGRHAPQHKPVHGNRRKVLEAMDGHVGSTVEQRFLHFPRKHSLPAHLGERRLPVAVADRTDFDDLDRAIARRLAKQVRDVPRLPHRQLAATSRDPDRLV